MQITNNKKGGKMKKVIKLIAWILVVIGALNWGLVGAFDLDLVDLIFGSITWLAKTVYILVGISALILIVFKLMKKGMKK